MFSPQKANLRIGEVTAAGLVKLFRPGVKQPTQPDSVDAAPVQGTAVWKVWVGVLVFLGLLVLVTVLAN
jgi:hypothetical protein